MFDSAEVKTRLDKLDTELSGLRRGFVENATNNLREGVADAFFLLRSFYEAPGHRLTANDANRAAHDAGFSPQELTRFYIDTDAALRKDGDGYVLTPAGTDWYEECYRLLMSRTE
jgi:hypothetical protein